MVVTKFLVIEKERYTFNTLSRKRINQEHQKVKIIKIRYEIPKANRFVLRANESILIVWLRVKSI